MRYKLRFSFPAVPGAPRTPVDLLVGPSAIAINNGSFKGSLGVRAEPGKVVAAKDYKGNTTAAKELPELRESGEFGAFGFEPSLLTKTVNAVYPSGTPFHLIDAQTIPHIEEVFNAHSAAAIWPDLNEASLTSEQLQLSMRLPAGPTIKLEEDDQLIRVMMPLEVMVKASIDDQWQHYSTLKIKIHVVGKLYEDDKQLRISLLDEGSVEVRGEWGTGYKPTLDLFEQDMAEIIFDSMVDYLYGSGPLMAIQKPRLQQGPLNLVASRPHIKGDYITLQMVSP